MKKSLKWAEAAAAGVFALGFLTACGGSDKKEAAAKPADGKEVTLKVGASPVPHAEVLGAVKDTLKKEGVNLEIVEFTDYVQPNLALAEKELDANYFQHKPYLDEFCKDRNLKLVSVANVHLEPMAVYSAKYKNLADLPDGAHVAIPNDPTNGGRALLVLQAAGLIKLRDGAPITATPQDVAENAKNLQFSELEAPQLPRSLQDADIAVINMNFALEAKLNPSDAIFTEGKDSPYANIVAVREGDEKRPEIQKLVKALQSETVKKFLADKYKGAIVPSFQ